MSVVLAHRFPTALGTVAVARSAEGLVAVALPAQTDAATRRGLETLVAQRRLGGAGSAELTWVDVPSAELAEVVALMRTHLAGDEVDLGPIELDLRGVGDFTREVYAAARRIPRGEVRTYGELAAEVGRPAAARAVGHAMSKNPFLVVVPCHRVIDSRGALHGFSAPGGLRTKAALLALEAAAPQAEPGRPLEGEPSAHSSHADEASVSDPRQAGLPFDLS